MQRTWCRSSSELLDFRGWCGQSMIRAVKRWPTAHGLNSTCWMLCHYIRFQNCEPSWVCWGQAPRMNKVKFQHIRRRVLVVLRIRKSLVVEHFFSTCICELKFTATIFILSEKSTKITYKFQVNHSGYDDRLFQITSQNDKVGNLKWWGFKVRKTSICFTVRLSSHWNEAGRSFGMLAVCFIVFSWCHGSLLQSCTILATQLLFAAPYSCYSILSIVFLSFSLSWRLTTLGIYCLMASDHCLFSGCLVLFFSFFEFYPCNKLLAYSVC